jgi:hypothetical protein
MMTTKGTKYLFKMSDGLADIKGYVLFEDDTFFHITNDGALPISVNKRFVVTYRETRGE